MAHEADTIATGGTAAGAAGGLRRVLALPFSAPSLLFVALHSLLLSLVMALRTGLLGLLPLAFLLSWLFKYACHVLEHAANGHPEAPVASTDMLGPFEQRPLLLFGVALACWALIGWSGSRSLAVLGFLLLALLPASLGVLGAGGGAAQALNPATLWRVVRGLGPWYAGFWVAALGMAALGAQLWLTRLWLPARVAILELGLLTLFASLGGLLHRRRNEIGFEPIRSPERDAELVAREDLRLREAALDEVYKAVRGRHSVRAVRPLQHWLSTRSNAQIGTDVQAVLTRALQWENPQGQATVVACIIDHLQQRGEAGLAAQWLADARSRLPQAARELLDAQREGPQRRLAAATAPALAQPGAARPDAAQPGAAQPGTAQPGAAAPAADD